MMFGFVSNVMKLAGRALQPAASFRQFHALPSTVSSNEIVKPVITNPWSLNSLRSRMYDNFPKASEYKRLKKHGWLVKLKTKNGRRMIMRRILKGRYYITH